MPPAKTPAAAPPIPPPPLTGSVTDVDARHDALRVLDWTVKGSSKVVRDAEVGFARVRGFAAVGGKLTAAAATVEGTIAVGGRVHLAGALRLRGEAELGEEVVLGELELAGRLAAAGALRCHGNATVAGRLEVRTDLEAAVLKFTGQLIVPGTLRATSVDGTLEGLSKVERIRADRIELRSPSFPPWKPKGTLHGLRIEAREARLEGVTLEFLEADEIYLGPECRIARVEGTIVERHRSARVGPSAVSTPWSGLTR